MSLSISVGSEVAETRFMPFVVVCAVSRHTAGGARRL